MHVGRGPNQKWLFKRKNESLHTKGTTNLSPAGRNIDVHNATVWTFGSVGEERDSENTGSQNRTKPRQSGSHMDTTTHQTHQTLADVQNRLSYTQAIGRFCPNPWWKCYSRVPVSLHCSTRRPLFRSKGQDQKLWALPAPLCSGQSSQHKTEF